MSERHARIGGRHILVTGGAGYVGSHCCKYLHASDYIPVTYDNFSRGYRWAVRWGLFEYGDIMDRGRISGVTDFYKPHAVMHFAGLAYVGVSMEHPGRYFRNNVAGTLALFLFCRLFN